MFKYRPIYEQVSFDNWNKLMYYYNIRRKIFDTYHCLYEDRGKNPNYKKGSPYQMFLEIKTTKAYLTMKDYNTWYNYVIDFNNRPTSLFSIGQMYRDMTRYFHIKSMDEDENIYSKELDEKGYPICYIKVTKALKYRIDYQYVGNAISYDINKAYLNALMNMPYIIDLDNPTYEMTRRLRDNEVGFDYEGNVYYEVGTPVEFAFKLVPNNKKIKKYCDFVLNGLKEAKNEEEILNWKMRYQAVTGNLKHHNVFFYNMIIDYVNRVMLDYIGDGIEQGYILSCTTDGVISTRKLDLPISNKVGEFKIEHCGEVVVDSIGYQWIGELPKITGFSSDKIKLYNQLSSTPFRLDEDYTFIANLPNMYKLDKDNYVISNEKIYRRLIQLYEESKN